MDYFTRIEKKPNDDLSWNIPEKKQGTVNVIGGNGQSFKTEVKVAEFLGEKYPIETINLILPDSLKNNLPNLPNFHFLPSTESGSFAESQELIGVFNTADFNLVIGDLSKNSITKTALSGAYKSSDSKNGGAGKMSLITRDGIEVVTETQPERILMNENLILLASMPQLIKLLRAAYYPKMLLLSQSLVQVAEVLHKFTLSYPVGVITLHNERILIAKDGRVVSIPLEKSNYTPLSLWQGECAAKIIALNLYNPNNFINATINAIFS